MANRNSRKSVKSTGSTNSRDVSPQDIGELQRDRADSLSSSNQPSPSHIGVFNLSIPDNDYAGTSSGYSHQMSSDDNDGRPYEGKQSRSLWQSKKGTRKSKHVPEIESLVEGVPLDSNRKQIPNPLILQKVRQIIYLTLVDAIQFFNRTYATLTASKVSSMCRPVQQKLERPRNVIQSPFPIVHRKSVGNSFRKMNSQVAVTIVILRSNVARIIHQSHRGSKMKF